MNTKNSKNNNKNCNYKSKKITITPIIFEELFKVLTYEIPPLCP